MPHEEKEDSFHGCRGAATEFTLPGAKPSYAPDLALEPTHIDIRMRFDVNRKAAVGFVTTTVRSNREGARSLKLDAVGLDDVAVRSESPLQWRYDGERIHLSWDSPFERGEERFLNEILGLRRIAHEMNGQAQQCLRVRVEQPCQRFGIAQIGRSRWAAIHRLASQHLPPIHSRR